MFCLKWIGRECGGLRYVLCRKYQSTYLHYRGTKSDINYVCKTDVVFGKIVVRMRRFPVSFRLHILCAYSLRSHNTSTITVNVILFPIKFSVRIVIAARTAESRQ